MDPNNFEKRASGFAFLQESISNKTMGSSRIEYSEKYADRNYEYR
jgi:hypothetical protein